jgi:DNA-binding transcriptional regulator YiaG
MQTRTQSTVRVYADKLRREGDFQYQVLTGVAAGLKDELKRRGEEIEDFTVTLTHLAALANQFSKSFTKKFWQQSAEKVLEQLEQWNVKQDSGEDFASTLDLLAKGLKGDGELANKEVLSAETSALKAVALVAAAEILQKSGLEKLVTETIEKLLGLGRKQPPATESHLFLNSPITPIPTPHVMVSSTELHLRKDRWEADTGGLACFKHRAKSNPNNYIEHYISTPGDISLLPWEEAQQIIDKLGFDTAKLHLIFAAHAFKQERPWESKFSLAASEIIKNLGWDRRTDIPKHKLLLEVASAAYILDCLLVKSTWIEGCNAKGQLQASTPTGRLWNVINDPWGTIDLFSGKVEEPYEVYITVQPGLWTQNTLNKAGSKAREALYQFGYLAEEILRIDPYHNELALRLAIHLTMQSRFHQSGVYRISTLLEEMLPQTAIEAACYDKRKAYDLKQRWDSALRTLINLQWQIEFDDQSYPEWLRPGSEAEKPEGWRKFKIIDRLLEAKITIKPPAPIPELIAAGTRVPKTTLRLPAVSLTGEQIREARQAKGWSQRKLAGWLGVSDVLIGYWEKGKRTPSPDMEAKLREILQLQK